MRTIPLHTVANNSEIIELVESADEQQQQHRPPTNGDITSVTTATNANTAANSRARGSQAHPFGMVRGVNWQRLFAVLSLIVALALLSGSIYLHLRQKNHLGRLRMEQRVQPTIGVEPATVTSSSASSSSSLTLSSSSSLSNSSSATGSKESMDASWPLHIDSQPHHITEACLQCICETATQCQPTICANDVDCGIFRISRPYWLDAGKPTLEGDINNRDDNIRYEHCVNNVYCAARVVAGYINKYARDCNQDGRIECRDHITVHLLGPSGCMNADLPPVFQYRMEDCLANFE